MANKSELGINPTPEEIHAELARVLASPDFVASRQLARFLQFVVDESLSGHEDRIKERTVAIRALGRDSTFDPRLDPIVRMVAGRLRRGLERYYLSEGDTNPVRIEIPKGSYRPRFIKADSRSEDVLSLSCDTLAPSMPTDQLVLAVLPFTNFSGGEHETHLADCLAQDLCVRLHGFSWFEVVDYLRARAMCASAQSPLDVVSRLHADFCLTGTIRRQGQSLRATVQLTDVAFGKIIWADTQTIHQRELELRSQDQIVKRIASTIGDIYGVLATAVLRLARRKPREKLTLCEAVLGNIRYQSQLADGMFTRAFNDAERAIAADPEFAWGWAALALLHIDNFVLGIDPRASDAADRALFCARQALRADMDCGLAHFSLGVYHLSQGDVDAVARSADRAVEVSQGSPFETAGAGALFAMLGEVRRSQSLLKRAQAINPRLPGWVQWAAAVNALKAGDHASALDITQEFSMPDCFWDHLLRASAEIAMGETADQESSLNQAISLRPQLSSRPQDFVSRLIPDPEVQELILGTVASAK